MSPFNGFTGRKVRLTPIPGPFFSELLPEIDHLGELKVLLYAFWRLDRMEGAYRCVRRTDFLADERFMQGLASLPESEAQSDRAMEALDDALERLVQRGVLLHVTVLNENGTESCYFLNSPKGRAAVKAVQEGKWRPFETAQVPAELAVERPNIFRLYEENIGPLTPMIAETLADAERTYPADWLEEAVRIAVEKNARSWRYIEAILRSWKEKGRDEQKQNRGDSEKDRRRYIEGEFSDFIEH